MHKADGGVYNGCVRLTTLFHRSNLTLQTGRPGNMWPLMSCRRKYMCVCAQSCPTLGNPMDCSPPGSSVHGILQARMLERVAIYSSRECSWSRDQTHVSGTAGRFFITEPLGKVTRKYMPPTPKSCPQICQSSGSNYQFMGNTGDRKIKLYQGYIISKISYCRKFYRWRIWFLQ